MLLHRHLFIYKTLETLSIDLKGEPMKMIEHSKNHRKSQQESLVLSSGNEDSCRTKEEPLKVAVGGDFDEKILLYSCQKYSRMTKWCMNNDVTFLEMTSREETFLCITKEQEEKSIKFYHCILFFWLKSLHFQWRRRILFHGLIFFLYISCMSSNEMREEHSERKTKGIERDCKSKFSKPQYIHFSIFSTWFNWIMEMWCFPNSVSEKVIHFDLMTEETGIAFCELTVLLLYQSVFIRVLYRYRLNHTKFMKKMITTTILSLLFIIAFSFDSLSKDQHRSQPSCSDRFPGQEFFTQRRPLLMRQRRKIGKKYSINSLSAWVS